MSSGAGGGEKKAEGGEEHQEADDGAPVPNSMRVSDIRNAILFMLVNMWEVKIVFTLQGADDSQESIFRRGAFSRLTRDGTRFREKWGNMDKTALGVDEVSFKWGPYSVECIQMANE